MEIRAKQEVRKAVDLLGRLHVDAHDVNWCMTGFERAYECFGLRGNLSQAEQRKTVVFDQIVDRKLTGLDPYVWQSRAGPTRWDVFGVVRLRTIRLVEDDGRIGITISKLRADYAEGFGRFQLRDIQEVAQRCFRLGRVLVQARLIGGSPGCTARGALSGRLDVLRANRPAFGFIRGEKIRPAPSLQYGCELPISIASPTPVFMPSPPVGITR
jgi:hypothetical protein